LQSTGTRTVNPIDHILLDGRHASSIMMHEVVRVQNVTRITIYSNLISTKYLKDAEIMRIHKEEMKKGIIENREQ